MADEHADPDAEEEPTDLKWIGPATAAAFADADLTAADVRAKRVSYRLLVDAGVNPGVAAKIRREHSLSWSFEAGDGLDQRSSQVRGLGTDEAAWVAASSGDWESTSDEADGGEGEDGGDDATADDAGDEAAWVAASTTDAQADDREVADGSGDPVAAEAAWRSRSKPTPLSTLAAVEEDETAEDLLAEAGITSVRSLATADPEHVADVLDIDHDRVKRWHAAARDARE